MTIETTDLNLGAFNLSGQVTALAPKDDVIRDNETWYVDVSWHLEGTGLNPSSAVGLRPGTWNVMVHCESVGTAAEHDFGPGTARWDSVPSTMPNYKRSYTVRVPINAGAAGPGLYRLGATITYTLDATGGPALMAGFIEGAIVNIYDAP